MSETPLQSFVRGALQLSPFPRTVGDLTNRAIEIGVLPESHRGARGARQVWFCIKTLMDSQRVVEAGVTRLGIPQYAWKKPHNGAAP